MNILVLSRYGRKGASSRHRIYQFLPFLAARGVHCDVSPLLVDEYLVQLYAGRKLPLGVVLRGYVSRARRLLEAGKYDLLWVQQDFFPWLPFHLESLFLASGIPYVVDMDDAFFHRYDSHPKRLVRLVLGDKLDRVMAQAALVVAGNDYLSRRAVQSGAQRVEFLPTVVDVDAYGPVSDKLASPFTVCWIGSPTTSVYLKTIRAALQEVQERTGARYQIIGAAPRFGLEGIRIENVPWSEETEIELLRSCSVGIMPLLDTPWERGKCGFKLLQYMTAGLPVVGSPVGVNRLIIEHGVNGFHARTREEWTSALMRLHDDPVLRAEFGARGRKKVEAEYSLDFAAPRLEALLRSARSGRRQ